VYLADGDPTTATAHAVAVLADRAGLAPRDLEQTLFAAADDEVVLHLFRVAAGLESLVPGESQILGQVREAHAGARAAGAEGPLLDRLLSQALRTGKRVRSETALAAQPASVAGAAAHVARQVVGELAGRRVLIIGAGKMSQLAAARLVSGGAENVFVANRTIARAEELARRYGGAAAGFDRLPDELERADVVVSSTRCPRLILTVDQVADVLPRRRGRPLLMIDIAVPRDLDARIGDLEGCDLYDIDDLGEIARADAPEAESEFVRAETIVAEEAERFCGWLHSLDAVPTITELRRKGEEIRAAALADAEGDLRTLSPDQRRAVETLTTKIVNKLLHGPTVAAKEAAARAEGDLPETVLRHLFGLAEEGA
jgi:glutamyl-tRNA reductase